MTLFALLVGIDAYPPPAPPLHGCRNDIEALADHLRARVDTDLDLQTFYDVAATRDAVISALRTHLGRAAAGDVALFAYAGHGCEEPAPPELADLEPTGRIQTLMLHDCNRRVAGRLRRALADKELSLLLAEVAAGGAHVAVILDCCHSGGATRDATTSIRGWTPPPAAGAPGIERDLLLELATARPSTEYLPETLEHWQSPRPPHVLLAACRSGETAKEHGAGEVARGAFSVSLLGALEALGPRPTYRWVLDATRSRVERLADAQVPQLFPTDTGGPADALFLDGAIAPTPSTFAVTRATDGWRVDAGSVHGLRAPVEGEAFVLACTAPDGSAAGPMRVTDVDVGRSAVEPIGWTPAAERYSAVIAEVPLPAAEVALDPGDPVLHAALVAEVTRAGPGGAPSTHVRIVDNRSVAPPVSSTALRLRVAALGDGVARITRADGSPIGTDVAASDAAGARLVVARLEHIARWEHVRGFGGHPSPLADAVELTVRQVGDDEGVVAGTHHLTYRRAPNGAWQPPEVFIELHNRSADDLFVGVVDLTDRFRCSTLFPAALVAAGHTVAVWDRRPIPVELPAGRPVAAGASARDWLQLIVSDADFDTRWCELPALDEPVTTSRSARSAPRTTLERLFARAVDRDVGSSSGLATARWTARTTLIETSVP